MARNTLQDLNDHLFAQMERLSDESLTQEQLKGEIERTKAISLVARNIIDNAATVLEAAKFKYTSMPGNKQLPQQFDIKE